MEGASEGGVLPLNPRLAERDAAVHAPPKEIIRRRIDLMTEEGVNFVTGSDASDPKIAKRLLKEYDAVVLCCGAEEPRPLGIDVQGMSGVCYAGDCPGW